MGRVLSDEGTKRVPRSAGTLGVTRAFVGVDVGQTGVRAAVLDDEGRLLGHAQSSDPVVLRRTVGGSRADHDARRWSAGMDRCLADALSSSGAVMVECVAIGALGPAPVLVDADLRPLTPAVLYRLDDRSTRERRQLEQQAGLAPGTLPCDHALPALEWWLRRQPDLRPAFVLDVAGLLVSRLTGEAVMDDVTFEQYYRLETIPPHPLLPRRVAGTDIAGTVTPQAARRTGLPAGVPVLTGGIDSFVDLFAAGLHGAGDAVILCGSTGVVALGLPPGRSVTLMTSRHFGTGEVAIDWTGSSGAAVQWIRDLLRHDSLETKAGALPPGAGGLRIRSHLAPSAGGQLGGAISGLTLTTTPAELMRAMLDSVAVELARPAWVLEDAGLVPDTWRGWGGGFVDPLLTQAVADAVGQPLGLSPDGSHIAGAAELARHTVLGVPARTPQVVVEPSRQRHIIYRTLADEIAELDVRTPHP